MVYAASGTKTDGASLRKNLRLPGAVVASGANVTPGTGVSSRATAALTAVAICLALLGSFSTRAQEPGAPGLSDSDVERLRGLLLRHHSGNGEAVNTAPDPEEATDALPVDASADEAKLALLLNAPYSRDKLLLRADEWPLLRTEVDTRLSDTAIAERRSDSPLIGTIQIRRRGSLVGSSTYNLRHIGKHQFVGQTKLGNGLNVFSVSDFQWELQLPPLEGSAKHLLVLTAPPRQDWTLHLVPASVLVDLQNDSPPWLGAASAETSDAP
ncbi:hypothetical protein [Congregibacter litoralis]|nr:hypothetical protein [Congregibacter litoralis]